MSTLNKSSLKKSVTPPTVKSDDEKLLAVFCSDFLVNQQMNDDFHQYFFLREEAKRTIAFFDGFLCKPSPPVALIGGSPGSGKSLTMFIWAWLKSCTVNCTFVFLTFLGSPKNFPLQFRFGFFQGGTFNYFSSIFDFSNPVNVKELVIFLRSNLKLEKAVLVLDGLTNFSKDLHAYFNDEFYKMFFVTSQQVFLGDVDKSIARESFRCFPWKLEDYNQVCCYDLFWNNMGQDIFDSTSMEQDSAEDNEFVVKRRMEMIHRKFFYAGYSARWMFRHAESTLSATVQAYASKVKDVEKYLFGTDWDKTDDAVNHILVELNMDSYVVVSFYAAQILAVICRDSSKIADYIRLSAIAVNDARMMGIAYEVHIRNLLNNSTGSSVAVLDKESREHLWTVNSVFYYNELRDLELRGGSMISGDWFFPKSVMQGGFDMFQVLGADGRYKVRFVQVTIAETHSFKQDYFVAVLSALHWVILKELQLVEVEVVGLVPEYRLPIFKYEPSIPIQNVYPDRTIPQTVLHCTVPNDGNWLRNPNQSIK